MGSMLDLSKNRYSSLYINEENGSKVSYKGHSYELKTKGSKMGTAYTVHYAEIDGPGGPKTDYFQTATEAGRMARKMIDAYEED